MNILSIVKSQGFWLFVALFVGINLLIVFVMKEARSNWTIFIVELIALLFYIMSQLNSTKDEAVFFFKSKTKES